MANKNKNKNKNKAKQIQPIEEKEEKKMVSMLEIMSILISAVALFVSIATVLCSAYYSNKEYTYKIDPQIEGAVRIAVRKTSAEYGDFEVGTEFELSITAEDNLDRAYIVYANDHVEELELDDMENILKGKTESGLTTTPDIEVGKYEYRYYFVYLESLDDNGELYLIYTKKHSAAQGEQQVMFNAISGIEVYGLENESHENAEEYAGEKIMAEKYVQLLSELPKYLGQ